MCGIAGFWLGSSAKGGAGLQSVIRNMADAIAHRGPDDSGVWMDAGVGIALGHRRLSIIDLSPQGHQPMHSASGRYVLTYNGEIYNYRDIRSELEKSIAFDWRGHSDTEVMLAAIEHWGLRAALERFNGMFAFALWDRAERVLHLARDRLGEKPLYYGWAGQSFLFGSELKALRAHPGWRGEIDRSALALLMRHDYIPAPHSIYAGIRKLPPATVFSLTQQAAQHGQDGKLWSYWSVAAAVEHGLNDRFTGDPDTAITVLDDLLQDAVRLRTIADVPLGAFLSGGIDSSTVTALMQRQSSQPIKTFSIGFHEQAYDEARQAKLVARHLGTDHTELYVTPHEAMGVIPDLPTLYDEPFADSSQIPTFLVSKLARRQVTVALSGDGGDELFAGYSRYFWGRSLWGKIGWMPTGLRRMLAQGLTAVPPERWNRWLQGCGALLPDGLRRGLPGDKLHKLAEVVASEDSLALYRRSVSHWREPTEVVLVASESPTAFTDDKRWHSFRDVIDAMMYVDTVSYLPDDILAKVDRASMGVSLEARVPLLDHHVVEFAWRLPLALKIRQGQGKWLLRQVLHRYVPKSLVERPKMGFGVPIDAWLRGPLREWAESLLEPARLTAEGFFASEPIRTKWQEHLSGRRNWQALLWNVLMFQAWLENERQPQKDFRAGESRRVAG